MVLAYLHLIRLEPSVTVLDFSRLLRQAGTSYRYRVALVSETSFAVSEAKAIDADVLSGRYLGSASPSLGGESWDCMALLVPEGRSGGKGEEQRGEEGSVVPNVLSFAVARSYSLQAAIPSAVLSEFERTNAALRGSAARDGAAFNDAHLRRLRARISTAPAALAAPISAVAYRSLEASPALLDDARDLLATYGPRPVTMLNLLAFNDGEPGRLSYRQYGQHFKRVGGARGGNAKIVGRVLRPAWVDGRPTPGTKVERWDELAIVHYPNIVAFCDMAAGEDYQQINQQYRLPALKDTLLLCTREVPSDVSSKL